jgi:hypothetical protein
MAADLRKRMRQLLLDVNKETSMAAFSRGRISVCFWTSCRSSRPPNRPAEPPHALINCFSCRNSHGYRMLIAIQIRRSAQAGWVGTTSSTTLAAVFGPRRPSGRSSKAEMTTGHRPAASAIILRCVSVNFDTRVL